MPLWSTYMIMFWWFFFYSLFFPARKLRSQKKNLSVFVISIQFVIRLEKISYFWLRLANTKIFIMQTKFQAISSIKTRPPKASIPARGQNIYLSNTFLCYPKKSCAILNNPVPSWAILCFPEQSCSILHFPVQSCTILCYLEQSCAILCNPLLSRAILCYPILSSPIPVSIPIQLRHILSIRAINT